MPYFGRWIQWPGRMDKKYLMKNDQVLERKPNGTSQATAINESLHSRLIERAMYKAFLFYVDFFGGVGRVPDVTPNIGAYRKAYESARSLGLFQQGGIREKDHLNLWCLGMVMAPKLYVESGIFKGSSLHAFLQVPGIRRFIGIDPNMDNLLLPQDDLKRVQLISDMDFGQVDIGNAHADTLVYFDDHIHTARRILEAHEKGIRYVVFDDSTGLEGVCQRLYPAVPTLSMILNSEVYRPGDELSWSYKPAGRGWRHWVGKYILNQKNRKAQRLTFRIDEHIISQCEEARALIKRCNQLPDLGEFIPQSQPMPMIDTTKYIVELDV
jgi:hypothetical protein